MTIDFYPNTSTDYNKLLKDKVAEHQKLWNNYSAVWFDASKSYSAKDTQVGGEHYKQVDSNMQPWAIIDAWELDFYAGNVLKYLLRFKSKDGIEDLRKARHYLDKMIEDYDETYSS